MEKLIIAFIMAFVYAYIMLLVIKCIIMVLKCLIYKKKIRISMKLWDFRIMLFSLVFSSYVVFNYNRILYYIAILIVCWFGDEIKKHVNRFIKKIRG